MGKFDGMEPKLVRQMLAEVQRAATQMRTAEGKIARVLSVAGVSAPATQRPVQIADACDEMVRDVSARLQLLEKQEQQNTATDVAQPKKDDRPADDPAPKTDQGAKTDTSDKTGASDKADKTDKTDKSDKTDTGRADTDKTDTDKTDKTDKSDTDKSDKSDKTEKSDADKKPDADRADPDKGRRPTRRTPASRTPATPAPTRSILRRRTTRTTPTPPRWASPRCWRWTASRSSRSRSIRRPWTNCVTSCRTWRTPSPSTCRW
ncbi:hypothetical protein [Thermocatellispora tengchongensis]|uniref:hypothetical protein n=1 Tax=Thermocatellispora tengchongensis TaxID=1073253 RepID=UPI003642979A